MNTPTDLEMHLLTAALSAATATSQTRMVYHHAQYLLDPSKRGVRDEPVKSNIANSAHLCQHVTGLIVACTLSLPSDPPTTN